MQHVAEMGGMYGDQPGWDAVRAHVCYAPGWRSRGSAVVSVPLTILPSRLQRRWGEYLHGYLGADRAYALENDVYHLLAKNADQIRCGLAK